MKMFAAGLLAGFLLNSCLIPHASGFQHSLIAHSNVLQFRPEQKQSRCFSSPTLMGGLQPSNRNEPSVALSLASTAHNSELQTEPSKKLDGEAVVKYFVAIAIQMTLFFAIFTGFDKLVSVTGVKIPFGVNWILFYACALKSRVLNPLTNSRPKVASLETSNERKRVMPSWTPPGFIFPIMWLLIIGPIRATASALIYKTTASYAHPAILSLMLHLSIGDVWNTINNVEKRFGVSVTGVLFVWLSKAFAAWQYYQVNAFAGKLVVVPLIWLTIAATLITATWRLNPDPSTGKPEPLYPLDGEKKTKFLWFTAKAK